MFNLLTPRESLARCECIVSEDQKLLEEFLNFTKQVYVRELHVSSKLAEPDFYDDKKYTTHLYSCLEDGTCVGGARIIIHYPLKDVHLPLEKEGFCLEKAMKNTIPNLGKKCYAELSRVVVHPSYRKSSALEILIKNTIDICQDKGCEYIFAHTHTPFVRKIRKYHTEKGLKMVMRPDIKPLKGKNYARFYLCYSSLVDTYKERGNSDV